MNDRGGTNGVGRVTVEIMLANNRDLQMAASGAKAPETVRRVTLTGVVDTGATLLVIPERVAQELGLPAEGEATVRYADHRSARRAMVGQLDAELLGRHGTFTAIVEPSRDTVLIGAIVLEALDLIVDCPLQTLRPRDPERIVAEIE